MSKPDPKKFEELMNTIRKIENALGSLDKSFNEAIASGDIVPLLMARTPQDIWKTYQSIKFLVLHSTMS